MTSKDDIIEALRYALTNLLPYVATQPVGCKGDKCREPWCYSCYGEERASECADRASEAHANAAQLLEQTKHTAYRRD